MNVRLVKLARALRGHPARPRGGRLFPGIRVACNLRPCNIGLSKDESEFVFSGSKTFHARRLATQVFNAISRPTTW